MSLLSLDQLSELGGTEELGSRLQEDYRSAWNTLKSEHESGLDSLEVIAQLTRLMDEIVDFVYHQTEKNLNQEGLKRDERLVLMALGSYGRRELVPHSDIDLLFLLPDKITPWAEEFTQRVLYTLWDAGLDVGYSTRSVNDCVNLAVDNFDVLTSVLDARFLQGNLDLYQTFLKDFRRKVLTKLGDEFVRSKLKRMEDRLNKHGGTVYVLEPNLKEGMGGLRDIHTTLWVAKVLYGIDRIDELEELDLVDRRDLRLLKTSLNFLQRVRCELHFTANAARDNLSMERQPYLAKRFGFEDRSGIPAVERFMQRYYTHAGQVHQITENIIRKCLEKERRMPRILRRLKEKDLGRGFYSAEGSICSRKPPGEFFREDPGRLMDLFKIYQDTNLELSPEIAVAVRRSVKLVDDDFRKNDRIREIFFSILDGDKRLYETLLLMNELGFLGSYIPEFAGIHCKMQHDYYHTYTVDEHSIRAIREIVELPKSREPGLEIFRTVYGEIADSRQLLLLVILLHDVGKGAGPGHSERGAEMAAVAAARLDFPDDDIDTIDFLIRNHLVMAHVAQRRDLNEEKTIKEFASLMETVERLNLMFLLTMADLRAVGPGVWNEWKGSLIAELFVETNRVLETGGLKWGDVLDRIERTRKRVEENIGDKLPIEDIRNELDRLTERAYLVFRPRKLSRLIALHLEMGEKEVVSEWHQPRGGGYTEFYVVANDHPGLFSRIAGVLAANNVNILGAQILTRNDGIVFDILQVTDSVMQPITDSVKFRLVSRELEKVLKGDLNVEDLIHTRKPSLPLARKKAVVVEVEAPTRIEIDNEVSDNYTVVDIYTKDRIGLLYSITSTLSSLGLSIHTAKVSTKVDQAADVFYLTDLEGNKIDEEGRLDEIRIELLKVLDV